ncbi:MAG: hypothetical protein PHC61_06750 [Chitinivibrionales bacterium]|nr:hypothetical protein [Chitinivibrionales bacterium]
MIIVKSVHGVPIRVTHERLDHIYDRHPEMRDKNDLIISAIGEPDIVQEGDFGTQMGVKAVPGEKPSKYIIVIYKELSAEDGFLLTSYFTRKPVEWRNVLWKR